MTTTKPVLQAEHAITALRAIVQQAVDCPGEYTFLRDALDQLRSATHADSVFWVTHHNGAWTTQLHLGRATSLPTDLCADAADAELPLQRDDWLVVPQQHGDVAYLLVLHQSAIRTLDDVWRNTLMTLASIAQMVRLREKVEIQRAMAAVQLGLRSLAGDSTLEQRIDAANRWQAKVKECLHARELLVIAPDEASLPAEIHPYEMTLSIGDPSSLASQLVLRREFPWSPDDKRLLHDLIQEVATELTECLSFSSGNTRRGALHGISTSRLVGESSSMTELQQTIRRIATTDLTVLILGENGTGKEIVSRQIHEMSLRSGGPFLAVNCAALTESLLESELFGHEKGAYTDADKARAGKFELATGGTLFLDEVGELSPRGQAQLLRVLEEKTVVRVGGHRTIPVDTRLIAATNRDLAEMVRDKQFREDLFYRLSVVVLEVPPLRQRGDDILLLADHFLDEFARRSGRSRPRWSSAAKQALSAHSWPGNVRELRNLMERLIFLYDADVITAEMLQLSTAPSPVPFSLDSHLSLTDATRQFQAAYIGHQIQAAKGNMTETAERLGLHRTNLYRKMKHLGMDPPSGET